MPPSAQQLLEWARYGRHAELGAALRAGGVDLELVATAPGGEGAEVKRTKESMRKAAVEALATRPESGQWGPVFDYYAAAVDSEQGQCNTRLPAGIWTAAMIRSEKDRI